MMKHNAKMLYFDGDSVTPKLLLALVQTPEPRRWKISIVFQGIC